MLAVSGEEGRESEELQKGFFVLLHALTANELISVVLELEGLALETLLSALIANASSHPEPPTRKACFQVRNNHPFTSENAEALCFLLLYVFDKFYRCRIWLG